MKTIKILVTLVTFTCCGGHLSGQEIFTFTNLFTFANLNKVVPDGQPAGVADFESISSIITNITSVEVTLDISGNFNGDLYCYLRHTNGFAVLLNRPGRTANNPDGYDDCGFQITLSDTANGDIHNYRNVLTPPYGFPVTDTWQPDARTNSPATVLDTSPRTPGAWLSSFNGFDPNGTWTLFLADLSTGGTNVLNRWQLEITGVGIPEPSSGALALFGAILVTLMARRRAGKKKHSASWSATQ